MKLHTILIYSPPPTSSTSTPKTLKLYKNRPDLDFSTASELSPTQTIEIPRSETSISDSLTSQDGSTNGSGVFEINLNRALWNTTTSITIFFEDNWSFGEIDVTIVSYLGFKGSFMPLSREPVNFLYEAAANPGDHKIPGAKDFVGGNVMHGQ